MINPHIRHDSWGRDLFIDFFDVSFRDDLPLEVTAGVALEMLFWKGTALILTRPLKEGLEMGEL